MKQRTYYTYKCKSPEVLQILHNIHNYYKVNEVEYMRLMREGVLPELWRPLPHLSSGFFKANPHRWEEAQDKTLRKLLHNLSDHWKNCLIEQTAHFGKNEGVMTVALNNIGRND